MTHAQDSPRMSLAGRFLAGGLGVGILVLLAVASRLIPDERGFGTHEQLGLTPCSFYRWTGWRCPTCGATTAWAHLLDGDLSAAMRANLAGTMLGGIAVVSVAWLVASAVAGRWRAMVPTVRGLLIVGSGLAVVAVFDWLMRVWF